MSSSDHSAELGAWIRLTLEPGVGAVTARQLLAEFGLPHQIFEAGYSQLSKVVPSRLAKQLSAPATADTQRLITRTLEWAAEPEHAIITLADNRYPPALLHTYDPPPVLYADGKIETLSRPMFGIVGTREASLGGKLTARQFARYLASQGLCIVSGLARGIDLAAHQGALQALAHNPTPTIAVMATGINRVYPAANLEVARLIKKNGLLLTELPLDSRASQYQFPRRNRIVAGLSKGLLVVEAAKKSGSLGTARMAAEMNKEVFAIPGSIHSALTKGCHELIRHGAKLVETTQDILEELHIEPVDVPDLEPIAPRSEHEISERALKLLKAMDYDAWHPDELTYAMQLPIDEMATDLMMLELAGKIHRLEDGRYQRIEP